MAAETVRIEIPIETVDETAAGLNSAIQGLKKLENAYKSAANSSRQAQQTVSKFDQQAQKTEKSLRSWTKEKYQVLLEAKDRITPILQTVGNGLRSFGSKTWSVTMKAVDLVTAPVRGIINLLRNPLFQMGTVLGVSVGLADTVNTYKDFESAMSQVKAISGATGSEFDKLTAKAKEMGATTKFTATESAEAFNYMAMAGWKAEDMMDGIEGILNLAAASGADLATTSDIVTDALTAFKMEASDAGHFSDVLAAASANANTNVSMMGETFKYAGAMAGTLGYSIEDVALMTGLMANSGIKATMSGTALNMIFTRLSTNTGNARDQLDDLGISFFNDAGQARDLSDVMEELRTATAGMSDEQKASVANTIAGTQAQKGLLAILNASTDDYKKLKDAIETADGAAADMAGTMMDNLQGSITLFQSALDGVKISFGERLSPYIRGIADWLTEQMPALEMGLDELMDWVDGKVEAMKTKFGEITQTSEWQTADFFGKGKILWDEFIAEPFKEWWDTVGKQKFADIAGDMGNAIGTGLHVGIMALLGIDIDETADAGSSLGASFARGFADGFDFEAIAAKLWEGLGNLTKSAGKILPGGQSADLGSLISLMILGKIASPALTVGKGIGKAFMPSQTLGGQSLVGTVLGSAGAGTGLLGLGANTAINLGAGNLAGGASLSAGALSALGLGAIAGGVVGAGTAISGGMDVYRAVKSNDEDEKELYGKKAGWKLGGVAAGAAAGAAIGSVIPVLGTAAGALIGAGIGGVAGIIGSKREQEKYEEQLRIQQEMAEIAERREGIEALTGVDINKATFASEALRDAMDDTEVSAQQFANIFRNEVAKDVASRFGDIKLTAQEIKDLASKFILKDRAKDLEKFSSAAESTAESLSDVKTAAQNLDRMEWKASLGIALTEEEKQEFTSGVADLIQNTARYIENQHYEVTSALTLLGLSDEDGSIKENLDNAYSAIQAELEGAGNELKLAVSMALDDGTITADEEQIIAEAQAKVAEISNRIAEASADAGFEAISFKFSSGNLSQESFDALVSEMQSQAETTASAYEEALTQAFAAHNLGGLSDEQLEAAKQAYITQMDELQQALLDYPSQSLADAYDLDVEDIKNAIIEGAASGVTWDSTTVSDMLDLDGLSEEAKAGLAEKMQSLSDALPEGLKEQLIADLQDQIPTFEEVMAEKGPISNEFYEAYIAELQAGADNADFSPVGTSVGNGLQTELSNSGLYAGATAAMNSALKSALESTTVNATVPVNITAKYNYTNPTPGAKFEAVRNAAGGYVSGGPQLSWLAEEGYGEFVIPTNPSRRSSALELYREAGRALGVGEHAAGGYVTASDAVGNNFYTNGNRNDASDYTETTGTSYGSANTAVGGTVEVNVAVNPTFSITAEAGQNEEDIARVIKKHIKEMADELGGDIAERLGVVFSNMPLKEA